MLPTIGKLYSINDTLWKVVLVQPAYIVAERIKDSMGTTFTRAYWNANAKFGTIGWVLIDEQGSYVLSEQQPPDQTAKMVYIMEP